MRLITNFFFFNSILVEEDLTAVAVVVLGAGRVAWTLVEGGVVVCVLFFTRLKLSSRTKTGCCRVLVSLASSGLLSTFLADCCVVDLADGVMLVV